MLKLGLIGTPIAHSLSPAIYEKLMLRDGVQGEYRLYEFKALPKWGLKDWMIEQDLLGINVTIPFKTLVISELDYVEPEAEAIGAVNTIIRQGTRLLGYNTDYHGIQQSLSQLGKAPKSAVVFGTGGASKAVQAVLTDRSIPCITVGRTSGDLLFTDITVLELKKHHWWINATPVGTEGLQPIDLPLPFEVLTPEFSIFDLVYKPKITPLMRHGMEAKATVLGGEFMLNEQAEKAWNYFQVAYY